ncbi:PTS fructose transporter subunit IIC, partial [Enterococcus faecalis]
APHGGFLVLPVVTHAVQWVLAILAGSLVGGLLLGFVQKSRIAKQEQSLSKK